MAEDAGTKALETAAKRLADAGEAVDEIEKKRLQEIEKKRTTP